MKRLPPETAHALTLRALAAAQAAPLRWLLASRWTAHDPRLAFEWRGLRFPSPVGLAAGFDKDARVPLIMAALGFGFVEVGTVTPHAQAGNPRPRLHRLLERQALVNSLGFPNQGMDRATRRLRRRPPVPVGVNIGKNATTPLDRAAEDYLRCLVELYRYGDYFTVNVSSPNTAGLTSLQAKPALRSLLAALVERRSALARSEPPKPLLVKLSPDLTEDELADALEVVSALGVEGVIAVNTSTAPAIKGSNLSLPGGVSGRPLYPRALEVARFMRTHGPRDLFVIGAGGVFTAEDAWGLLQAGANAVQLYTGMVYRGPGIAREINRGLARLLHEAGRPSISALAE